MVTQEHLGEYQNIINEIFVTAPRAVMEENMIEVKNLCKNFGDLEVIKDVSFTIEQGDIFGIIGQSGAAKWISLLPDRKSVV